MQLSIENISFGIIVLKSLNGHYFISNINKYALDLEEKRRENVIEKDIFTLFSALLQESFVDALHKAQVLKQRSELEINICSNRDISGWRYMYISLLESGEILLQYRDLSREKSIEKSKNRQQLYLEEAQAIAHVGNWTWNMENNDVYWSDEVYRIFSEEVGSFKPSYEKFLSYLDKEDVIALNEAIHKAVEHKKPYEYSHKVYCKDGSIRFARALGYVKFDENDKAVELVGTILDVTEYEEAKQRETFLAQAIEQMDEFVRITDKNGIILYVNEASSIHSGYTSEELVGQKISIYKSDKHDRTYYKELWDTILSGNTYKNIIINREKNGELYHEEMTITPIYEKGEIVKFIATGHDISKRIELEKRLEKLATKDALTGIYNRHKINEELEKSIAINERYNTPFSLIMIDIDHFKEVNDEFGHDVGDKVLKELSTLISKHIRKNDIFGRWGGEEFLLLLPNISKKSTMVMVKKIKDVVEEHSFVSINQLTISLGVTQYKRKESQSQLLKRVDNALYAAKEGGRNLLVYY